MPAQNRIIFSTTGYSIESPKSAIVNVEKHGGQFQLKDAATQAIVYTGPVRKEKTGLGEFETIDFSDFKTQGRYVIQVGMSPPCLSISIRMCGMILPGVW